MELLIAGAGSRGSTYAGWAARYPDRARVVAVAEPRDAYRDELGDAHGVPPERRFRDWREAAAAGRLADAAVVATLDRDHVDPALAFADQGYALLLEKPLAPTEEECRTIVDAVERAGVVCAVAHVLRYTPYTRLLKRAARGRRGGRDRLHRPPRAGRLLAPGPFVRARELAARGRDRADAARQVLPRPRLALLRRRPPVHGRLLVREPDRVPARAAPGRRRRALRGVRDRAGVPVLGARLYLGHGRAGRDGVAGERRRLAADGRERDRGAAATARTGAACGRATTTSSTTRSSRCGTRAASPRR